MDLLYTSLLYLSFLTQLYMYVYALVSQWGPTLRNPMDCPWGFSGQEYWSGLPFSPPRDLPNPEIEPRSLGLQAELPGKPFLCVCVYVK